jgi:hypothetical protein
MITMKIDENPQFYHEITYENPQIIVARALSHEAQMDFVPQVAARMAEDQFRCSGCGWV